MVEQTDYERELARIDGELARLEGAPRELTEKERARRLAHGRYQRAALTGDLRELSEVEYVIGCAIERIGPSPELSLLRANLALKLHRVSAVRRDLSSARDLMDFPEARALQADLDLQEGRYKEARRAYEALIGNHRSWDVLARLAHLETQMGTVERAERLYLEAEDEITAKEMRSYAWLEVQRGLLDVCRGRYEEAEAHYRRANRAYSGYWQVEERIAEILGVQGKTNDAIALYRALIARHARPEHQQALGRLLTQSGRRDEAERLHERALTTYLESAQRGEVHYLHHLAEFYADVRPDGAEAVRWARKDYELRPNVSTQAALAWALYRDGRLDAALGLVQQSLASGARDAGLFYRAGTILEAAGRVDEGHRYLHAAAEINPRLGGFHQH